MTTDDLIHRATSGTITADELASVAESLRNRKGDDYDHLLVLGRAGATQYRSDVEDFLNCPDDPMLSRLALQVLCRYWGLAEDYASDILRFVKGLEWDEDEDVRIMAISCSDSLLALPQHRDLLAEVYRIATDPDEDHVARQAAYSALAISIGVAPSELPSPARFNIDTDIDPRILEDAKTRLTG